MTSRDLPEMDLEVSYYKLSRLYFLCFHLLDLSFGCSPTKLILLRKNKLRKKKQ